MNMQPGQNCRPKRQLIIFLLTCRKYHSLCLYSNQAIPPYQKKIQGYRSLADVVTHENAMTVRGTLNKFGFLFLMVMGTTFIRGKNMPVAAT